jgi:hypothetical protein
MQSTPHAPQFGRVECVRALLAAGAKSDAVDSFGNPAVAATEDMHTVATSAATGTIVYSPAVLRLSGSDEHCPRDEVGGCDVT